MPDTLSLDDATAWLRLSYAGLPTPRTRALLAHFGAAQALLDAARSDEATLRAEFKLTKSAIERLRAAGAKDVSAQLEAMREHRIGIAQEADYPPQLRQIGDDTPPFLFIRGDFTPGDTKTIGIVGTRNMTEYGRGLAHTFGVELSRVGWTVASGLAEGIDTEAHKGALDGGGRTLAATGCGLDIVYPAKNRELMSRIEGGGAVVSEWAPTTPPASWHFPARNRIIVGLSRAVIVVEAQEKSGALITANFATDHDRQVFAVPGNIHKPQSRGTHLLIKDGAMLMECVDDVLSYLGNSFDAFDEDAQTLPEPREIINILGASEPPPPVASPPKPRKEREPEGPPTNLAPNELRVWLLLEPDPRHMDDLAEAAALEPGPTNAALVMLELKGFARRLPGNLFVKAGKIA